MTISEAATAARERITFLKKKTFRRWPVGLFPGLRMAPVGWSLGALSCAFVASARANDPLEQRIQLDIAADSPLDEALLKWSVIAHIQIMMSSSSIAQLRTHGVHGETRADAALSALLEGTGLRYTVDDQIVHVVPSTKRFQANYLSTAMSRGHHPWPSRASSSRSVVLEGESGNGLEEVVVTAQKREERLHDVPISIAALTGGSLDHSTSDGINEELSRVAGVVMTVPGTNGLSQMEIRGVAAAGGVLSGSTPIAYYLDAVPFAFVRSAYIPDASPFDLERVEILRGPQGTLYGASAEDGVVRVLTHDADLNDLDLKARVLGSGTDSGGLNSGASLAVNVPLIQGILAIRGVVDYRDRSGWIDRPDAADANDEQLRSYRAKIRYEPIGNMLVDLSSWNSRQYYAAPRTGLSNGTAPDSGTTAEPVINNFDAYSGKINYQVSRFSVSSATSYLNFTNNEQQDTSPYGGSFLTGQNLHAYYSSRVWTEEILLNSTDTGRWHWNAGAFYRDARDNFYQFLVPTGLGELDFTDRSRAYAVFGQFGRRFWDDKLEWTLGVRQFHDDVSTATPPTYDIERSFNATTPRVVLTWYPDPDTTVYMSFSEGFRSGIPQYYGVGASDPSLAPAKPDKLYNYEVGSKVDFLNHNFNVDATVFYVKWKDVQQQILVPLLGGGHVPALVNGTSASGLGVDFSITVVPVRGLQLGATLSWNELEQDRNVFSGGEILFHAGDRLNNSSEYTGSLFASYAFPLGSTSSGELSVSGNYTSRQLQAGIGADGLAYTQFGDNLLFARAVFIVTFNNRFAAKVFGDNLSNSSAALQNGFLPGYALTSSQFTPRPRPRTVGLEVDYRLK